MNTRYFLLEDEKIVSRFVFFSQIDLVFNEECVFACDYIDGVDRILGKEGVYGFNLKIDTFTVAEGLGKIK